MRLLDLFSLNNGLTKCHNRCGTKVNVNNKQANSSSMYVRLMSSFDSCLESRKKVKANLSPTTTESANIRKDRLIMQDCYVVTFVIKCPFGPSVHRNSSSTCIHCCQMEGCYYSTNCLCDMGIYYCNGKNFVGGKVICTQETFQTILTITIKKVHLCQHVEIPITLM